MELRAKLLAEQAFLIRQNGSFYQVRCLSADRNNQSNHDQELSIIAK